MTFSAEALPYPILIADIGATHARFAIVTDAFAGDLAIKDVPIAQHADVLQAIQKGILDKTSHIPRSAVLAVAAPIQGDSIQLTNANWVIEPEKLIKEFALDTVAILNDFEAQVLVLPTLAEGEMGCIGPVKPDTDATMLALGPGTGLGAAALLQRGDQWFPVPGEGGHMELASANEDEAQVFAHVERLDGRISAEHLLCGPGLVRLYRAVAASRGESPAFDDPAAIVEAGMTGGDATANATLDLFATLFGRFAGDLALAFLATGGVFLAGGISPKIAPVLRRGGFRKAFEAKAPHTAIMQRIATCIVTRPDPGVAGLAAFAAMPNRFAIDFKGRIWTAGR